MQRQVIGHGAEATVYKVQKNQGIFIAVKQRVPKKYRHPDLDKKINQTRIRSEAKIMKKLQLKNINVPTLIRVDEGNHLIEMSYISGRKMKDRINDSSLQEAELDKILYQIGNLVREVHQTGIIHGDLTTSNMIIDEGNQLFLIDFGLSYFKDSAQDRAVDLYVLERAFKSTHPHLEHKMNLLLMGYANEAALKKLQVVRQRGRKKVAFG